jgi:hypothetical protein
MLSAINDMQGYLYLSGEDPARERDLRAQFQTILE